MNGQNYKNSSLIKNTINEAIRLGSPIRSFSRKQLKIMILKVIIFLKIHVMMLFASANRDEEIFKNSHKFDIERSLMSILVLGMGYIAVLESI